jgi:peptide/nickel transport system substrate-binding protein
MEIYTAALVTNDRVGGLEPRLAASIPSLDDGSIVLLPDGRMQTTWRLRPGITWQDGTPLTSADVVLAWRIEVHPEFPIQRGREALEIESVEAIDPLTFLINWKSAYYLALQLGATSIVPLPSHLLAEAFEGDKTAFQSLPLWTTEWVSAAAYQLVDFGYGETMVFERFDNFVLGRPRVDRLIVRTINDANTALANLLSGSVDIVTERVLTEEVASKLRDDWRQNGGGIVVQREGSWVFTAAQFSPEWGRPPELARDVRTRRGLRYGLDLDALREAVQPGFTGTESDTFMLKGDPRAAVVGKPFARYRYDPAQAVREFAAAGWVRAPDGRLTDASSEQVRLNVRASVGYSRNLPIVAYYWRALGIDISEEVMSPALTTDNEYLVKYPSFEFAALSNGDGVFRRYDGRVLPTAQNRYSASNRGSYVNPELDRLIARLYVTVDEPRQALLLKEMGEMIAADLPSIPVFFEVLLAEVRSGVRALEDDFAGATQPGTISRNVHLWDRD